MPDQYSKLVGYTSKYPYLVGVTTESGNLGTGILIRARYVLTCGHVMQDSDSAEVISDEGSTRARIHKVNDSLDLALLKLARPISAPELKFTDSPLHPGAVVRAVGIQETPGQPEELSVAETELIYQNTNYADGKILDIQFEGGARPGYSGGPVVAEKGGALHCVGVLRRGGIGAGFSNAIGPAPIRAFLKDTIQVEETGGIQRLLILTAILFGVLVVGVIAKRLYVASHSPTVASNTVSNDTQKPEKTAEGQSVPVKNTPTGPARVPSDQTPPEPTRPQDVKVWVNTASNVYHCPGTRLYGKTKHGKYMTQAEARKERNRPAYGKVCK